MALIKKTLSSSNLHMVPEIPGFSPNSDTIILPFCFLLRISSNSWESDFSGCCFLPHFVGYEVEKNCDLFQGRWIPDLGGSQYTNWSCRTIPESKNCFMHGRQDRDFLNWRWKPDKCDLPRFDPKTFLEIVRGKKLAFVGDSVARNHMESLLCLLSNVSFFQLLCFLN